MLRTSETVHEMVQQAKLLAMKPDDQRLIPGTHTVGREKHLQTVVSNLHLLTVACTHTHPSTHVCRLTHTIFVLCVTLKPSMMAHAYNSGI